MHFIKYFFYFFLFVMPLSTSAQKLYNETELPTRDFVRIYNTKGKKINKGLIISYNDSTLVLRKNYILQFIPFKDIATIKTNRSFGHSICIGGGIGSVLMAIILISNAEKGDIIGPEVAGFIGAGIGGIDGGLIGCIAHGFKKMEKYNIKNNHEDLKTFKHEYNKYYIHEFTSKEKLDTY